MNPLIISTAFGEYGEVSGVVTALKNITKEYIKHENQATVITYGKKETVRKKDGLTEIIDCPTLPITIEKNKIIIDLDPGSIRDFRWFSEQTHFDYVYNWAIDPVLVSFAKDISEKLGIPLISMYHTEMGKAAFDRFTKYLGPAFGQLTKNLMDRYIDDIVYKGSDLIQTPSPIIKEQISNRFDTEIKVLSRGVDTIAFDPSKRTRPKDNLCRALYLGRICPEKNLDDMMRYIGPIPDLEIMMIGPIPYEKVNTSWPITYTGKMTGKGLYKAVADADIFVFPSLTDTFGQAIQEAFASGLPAVVMDAGGPPGIIKASDAYGGAGFIAKDMDEFAHYVTLLKENKTLRYQMGKNARKFAETRTWKKIYEQLESQVMELKR